MQKGQNKAHRILARTHISHGRLIKIIDAYCRWDSVGAAARSSSVSRLTVGKIYNLIRKRLLDFLVFQSDRAYRNIRYDMENDEEEGQPWYDEEHYTAKLKRALGRYRGITPAQYLLFEAEAVFRVTRPSVTPGEMKTLVMETIKKGGPLNEAPRPDKIFEFYMDRVIWPQIDQAMKEGLGLLMKAEHIPD